MRGTGRQVLRMLLHVAVPALGAAAPLAVVPAVTASTGASGWAATAVGTSVGVAGAVVAELGWSIVGPQAVAREAREDVLTRTFAAALTSKLVAVAVVLPLAVLVTATTVEAHRTAAGLVTAGVVLGALSPTWWFIGRGEPVRVLLSETLPRIVALCAAAAALSLGAPLEVYGAALVVAATVTVVLAPRLDPVTRLPRPDDLRDVPSTLRGQGVLVLGRAVTTTYKSLPAALLAATAPGAVALFAAVDRPLRLGLQVLSSVPDRLQTWVGATDVSTSRRRTHASLALNGALGLLAGVGFVLAMPVVVPVLFAGTIQVPTSTVLLGGVLVGVVCASRGVGLALVTEGRAGHTASAAAASALVGVPGVLLLGSRHGADGALVALVAAEWVGVVVQAVVLCSGRRTVTVPVESAPLPVTGVQGPT